MKSMEKREKRKYFKVGGKEEYGINGKGRSITNISNEKEKNQNMTLMEKEKEGKYFKVREGEVDY